MSFEGGKQLYEQQLIVNFEFEGFERTGQIAGKPAIIRGTRLHYIIQQL